MERAAAAAARQGGSACIARIGRAFPRRTYRWRRTGSDRADPGFGFGKSLDENYPLLAQFEELHRLGYPVLAGPSRKRFLGRTLAQMYGHEVPPDQRVNATITAITTAVLAGAHLIRVHDVQAAREAVAIADAIRGDSPMASNDNKERFHAG